MEEAKTIATWVSSHLKKSSRLVTAKRAIWATSRRIFRGCNGRIIDGFPIFLPESAGSFRDRAQGTIKAAHQTFPLIVDLISFSNRPIKRPIPIESFINSESKRVAAAQLKSLFDHFGSDKAKHDYPLLYGSILAEPQLVTDLLEVGIGTNNTDMLSNMGKSGTPGASLRAFRAFLPHARIYGADADKRILFDEERISTFFVDQTEPQSFDLLSAAINHDFDLIIDDGLHSPNANIATILFGLERLKIGGWLVVEDIPPRVLPLWQVISTLLPEHYESHIVASNVALLFSVRRLK